jgi:hypothetical protein
MAVETPHISSRCTVRGVFRVLWPTRMLPSKTRADRSKSLPLLFVKVLRLLKFEWSDCHKERRGQRSSSNNGLLRFATVTYYGKSPCLLVLFKESSWSLAMSATALGSGLHRIRVYRQEKCIPQISFQNFPWESVLSLRVASVFLFEFLLVKLDEELGAVTYHR